MPEVTELIHKYLRHVKNLSGEPLCLLPPGR